MEYTALPKSAVTNDQVFLLGIVERLDQLHQALETIEQSLEKLEETIAKQATPVVNVNFDINALAKQLAAIQAQRDEVVEEIETKKRAKPK